MKTPSKINLFLRVVRRRNDGYHELETLFYPLNEPSDAVRVTRMKRPGIEMSAGNAALPCDKNNLCVKALLAFCEAAGIEPEGFRITLEKHIPIAAGMGGGSSDAAAVLRSLQKKFAGRISADKLSEIAKKIGADVPFFLHPVPTLATGIGEKRSTVRGIPKRLPILIAAPQFPVSAKWAYQHWHAEEHESDNALPRLIQALRKRDFKAVSEFLRNDLQASAMKKFPALRILEAEFRRLNACGILMTGSGPTMFALFESFEARDKAAKEFSENLPVRLIVPD